MGVAATPDGGGYWLVASDGGVFGFGDAGFHLARKGENRSIGPWSGWRRRRTGWAIGWWRPTAAFFGFGDTRFSGSAGATPLVRPAVGVTAKADGGGYWIAASDGGVFNYGDAAFNGSMGGVVLNRPVVGVASAS